MLETLNNDLRPLHISWFDRLLQYFGFFSKDLCLQANRLIDRIQSSLNHGWLNEHEAQVLKEEHSTWQTVYQQLRNKQSTSSPKKLYTLGKRLEKTAIRRKISDFYQFQDLIRTLNQPEQWERWQTHSKQDTTIKQLRYTWLSFCDVAGLQRNQAVIVWHALESLRQHFNTIQTYKTWRFMWLKKDFYKKYLKHIKRNIKTISHLQAQIVNYLHFNLQTLDTEPDKHPMVRFIKQLNATNTNPLTMPPLLQDTSTTPTTMQAIYHVLYHSHLRPKLQRHHFDLNGQLVGCMWHGQWLWLPSKVNAWLSSQPMMPWHQGYIRWLQRYAITHYPATRMICKLNTSYHKPTTINNQLAWLSEINTYIGTIVQWQDDINQDIKKYPYHPLMHKRKNSLSQWHRWLKQQHHTLQKKQLEALSQLWALSTQQQHQWLHSTDVMPAYHLLNNAQHISKHLARNPLVIKLQQHIGTMALIHMYFEQPTPTPSQCQQLLGIANKTKACQNTLQKMAWHAIHKHHHLLRKQLTYHITCIIKPCGHPVPLTAAADHLSLLVKLLIEVDDQSWVALHLNILLLGYLKTHNLHPPKSLAWSGRAQITEALLDTYLGQSIYLGQPLASWIKNFRQCRRKEAWQSYRFKATQLYQNASKKILIKWVDTDTEHFDRATKTWFSASSHSQHLTAWYEQYCQTLHQLPNTRPTSTSNMPLSASDHSIIHACTTPILPLFDIAQARFFLWHLAKHTQQQAMDELSMKQTSIYTTTITMLMKPWENHYIKLHISMIDHFIGIIDNITQHPSSLPNKKGHRYDHSTTTKKSMLRQHTCLQPAFSSQQQSHAATTRT